MTVTTDFQRARRPEHKLQRREEILAAARRLAIGLCVQDVTLSAVASEVGLATSNLLRYFGNREEIYLELASREWEEWASAVERRLRRSQGSAGVATTLTATLARRPLFCDLLSQVPTNLESNVSTGAARTAKVRVLAASGRIAAAIRAADPGIPLAAADDLVGVAVALASATWPLAHPSPAVVEVYEREPELRPSCIDFRTSLQASLETFVAGIHAANGASATRTPGSTRRSRAPRG